MKVITPSIETSEARRYGYITEYGAIVAPESDNAGYWLAGYYDDAFRHFRRFKAKNQDDALKIANDGGMKFVFNGGKNSWKLEAADTIDFEEEEYETELGGTVTNEGEEEGYWVVNYYCDGDMYYRRFKAKDGKAALKIANDGAFLFILEGGKDSWSEEW